MPILKREPVNQGEARVSLSVRLPPDLAEFIDETCDLIGISKNTAITQMLSFARAQIEKGR